MVSRLMSHHLKPTTSTIEIHDSEEVNRLSDSLDSHSGVVLTGCQRAMETIHYEGFEFVFHFIDDI